MMLDWVSVNLGDVCTKIGSGATPRGGKKVYLETGPFALIRSQNVHNDGFRLDGLAFINDQHADELANVEVFEDDVLLNITGDSVARSCQVNPHILPARVNQHVSIIRPNPDRLDARYLHYYLISPETQAKLLSWAGSGGTRNALTKSMIELFTISAPADICEQRAIAHVLGTLDDKIELNRRMNETLEAMTRAIFKSWFVDFDPVRAKMEDRQPYGMDEETAALFPDRLVDSELGMIPEAWEVCTINQVAEIVKGRSYSSAELAPSSTALVTLKSIARGGGYRPEGLKPFTGMYKPEQIVKPGELVVAYTDVTQAAEVIGKPAIVRSDSRFDILVASLDLAIIRPTIDNLGFLFLKFLFRTEDFQGHVYGHTNGTTVLHLAKNGVPSYEFALPSPPILKLFNEISSATFQRIVSNERESRTLATIRDALLPKLISGEIRLADVETIMAEAT